MPKKPENQATENQATKIAKISLAINVIVAIGLTIWNTSFEIRLRSENSPKILITTGSQHDPVKDIFLYHFSFLNTGSVDVENLQITVASEAVLPLTHCSLDIPFDNVVPRLGQTKTGEYYIFDIPTFSPSARLTGTCMSAGYGNSFLDNYKLSPEQVPCTNSNLSQLVPRLQYYWGKNLEKKNIDYDCNN